MRCAIGVLASIATAFITKALADGVGASLKTNYSCKLLISASSEVCNQRIVSLGQCISKPEILNCKESKGHGSKNWYFIQRHFDWK